MQGSKTFVTTPAVGALTWWICTRMGIPQEYQAGVAIMVMGAHTYLMRMISNGPPLEGLRNWFQRPAVNETDVDRIVKKMAPIIVRAIVYNLTRRNQSGES